MSQFSYVVIVNLCMGDLSIVYRRMLRFPSIVVYGCMSTLSSNNVSFTCECIRIMGPDGKD